MNTYLAVDLRAPPRRRAHQQRRRAGAAHGGAQAQDQRPDALDARAAVRRPGLLGDGELPPPGPRPARLDGAGAARLAGRRPGSVAAAERLSAAAALTFLTFCAWCPGKLNLPGCAGLGVSRRGGVNTYLQPGSGAVYAGFNGLTG